MAGGGRVVRVDPDARRRSTVGVGVPALVAIVIAVHQLTRPSALSGVSAYDDGVYFAAAVRLVHGELPYVDYAFVHPPGSTLAFAPFALLGTITGTGLAFAVARIAMAAVAVANVALVAWLVRRHGPVAMIAAGLVLACFPLAVSATHTTLLEPLLVLSSLSGLAVMFDDHGRVRGGRATWRAGLLLGMAGLVKSWAVLVFVPVLVVCILSTDRRRQCRSLISGGATSFGAVMLFFLILDPTAVVRDVVGAQIGRSSSSVWGFGPAERLVLLTGVGDFPDPALTRRALVVTGAFVLVVALTWWAGRARLRAAEYCLMGAAVTTTVAVLLVPADFYRYYTYFPIALIAPVCGISFALARDALVRLASPARDRTRTRRTVTGVMVVAMVAATFAVLRTTIPYVDEYLSPARDSSALLQRLIPSGACVVFDEPAPSLVADRFPAGSDGCPRLVDPIAVLLTENDGRLDASTRPFEAAAVNAWAGWIDQADYVVLAAPGSSFIPWTPALSARFADSFVLVGQADRTFVYERRS